MLLSGRLESQNTSLWVRWRLLESFVGVKEGASSLNYEGFHKQRRTGWGRHSNVRFGSEMIFLEKVFSSLQRKMQDFNLKMSLEMFIEIRFQWPYTLSTSLVFLLTIPTAAKSLQSCPTLHDPIGGSLPGSPIPGILKAKTLEWVSISYSNAWKWKVKVKLLSCVRLLATPWTAAYQVPPPVGFSRQEYWSGVPLPSPT